MVKFVALPVRISNVASTLTVTLMVAWASFCCMVTGRSAGPSVPCHSLQLSSATEITWPTDAPTQAAISSAFLFAFFTASKLACRLATHHVLSVGQTDLKREVLNYRASKSIWKKLPIFIIPVLLWRLLAGYCIYCSKINRFMHNQRLICIMS